MITLIKDATVEGIPVKAGTELPAIKQATKQKLVSRGYAVWGKPKKKTSSAVSAGSAAKE